MLILDSFLFKKFRQLNVNDFLIRSEQPSVIRSSSNESIDYPAQEEKPEWEVRHKDETSNDHDEQESGEILVLPSQKVLGFLIEVAQIFEFVQKLSCR